MHLLQSRGSSGLASGAWARFDANPANASFVPFANWRDLGGVEFLQLHYEEGCMMHPAAWLAPRALLERAGPWDETLSLNDDGEYFAPGHAGQSWHPSSAAEAHSYYRSNLPGSLSPNAPTGGRWRSLFHSGRTDPRPSASGRQHRSDPGRGRICLEMGGV